MHQLRSKPSKSSPTANLSANKPDNTNSTPEPLAIIGMACRFPGGCDTPEAFWQLLCSGQDGIIEVPDNRWSTQRFYDPNPDKPGKTPVKHGGYLQSDIEEMDALFFGITPREAETLDPQQRLLLEVSWEALEDAGLIASELAGSDTGVFIGGFMMDHLSSQTGILNRHLISTHSAVSFSQTLLSARLAYYLDLRGPCLTMDTACSSSLVAMYQACQAIWSGSCQTALVGGVNVMYRAETPMTMAKGHFLATDGRSKSFDARGDGYGRGEGAGMVVLKPLAQARQDGDLIYAAVCAAGMNQDGRTDGITVPNPQAQSALIESVWQRAKIDRHNIVYVEAHGTGTALGDPLECQALNRVLNRSSTQTPCWIGSVKANIGHLEAAAGIAGLIKTSLCLAHEKIPPVAHLETPNPDIAFEEWGLRLPQRVEPLPKTAGDTYAAVNAFGYGGTNAHALLKHIAPDTAVADIERPSFARYFLPISARSETALTALARRYEHYLRGSNAALTDICYSAATRREHHRYRLGLNAASKTELVQQLQDFCEQKGQSLASGKASVNPRKPVFVMTGMGPQWWAMGQELLQQEPVFRRTAQRCDAIFQTIAGWSILEAMGQPESDSRMQQTEVAQPANFVLQVALHDLLIAKGIQPAAIVGHSVGEVSAAYVSGVLTLEQALCVSYHRSRLQQTLAGRGKMLAVGLSAEQARQYLATYEQQEVSIAAINSHSAVTLSGDCQVLTQLAEQLEAEQVFNRFLRVEVPYHSPVMNDIQEELLNSLCHLTPRPPKIPLYSTVSGQEVTDTSYDAAYWFDNVRQPVQFAEAIGSLAERGCDLFLEVGPHPVLATSIKDVLSHHKQHTQVVASLQRKQAEQARVYQTIAELYCHGVALDWYTFYSQGGQYVRLPLYPWQRQRYWLESDASLFDRLGSSSDHPLLGHTQNTPSRFGSMALMHSTCLGCQIIKYRVL